MALVLRVRLVLTKPLSLDSSSVGWEPATSKGRQRESVLESMNYGSGLRFWNELLVPLGLLYHKLKMSASTFQNVQTTEKQYFFFFAKPDLNSHESINRTPFHPRYIPIHIHVMMHLSGHLIHPGGGGDAQHSLFWNTSSPPALLQTSRAYLLIVYAKLFIFGTAGVILFPRHYCIPQTVFTESIFRLHSNELFLIKV